MVGVAIPFALDYFHPEISKYLTLPPSAERWTVLIIFGALLAAAGFFQSAYENGEFRWLAGKIGGGLVELALYTYLLFFLPIPAGSQNFQLTGLIWLIYATIFLSYLSVILDFIRARRNRMVAQVGTG